MLRQDVHAPVAQPPARVAPGTLLRVLAVGVVVLLGATLVLGAMLFGPTVSTSPNERFADDMIAAWNDRDPDRLRAVYTEDAFVWTSAGTAADATGIDEIVDLARFSGLTIERIGPISEHPTLLSYPIHVSNSYDVEGDDAVAVLVLQDGKIAEHWVIWSGT
jgi:hypothetical protein